MHRSLCAPPSVQASYEISFLHFAYKPELHCSLVAMVTERNSVAECLSAFRCSLWLYEQNPSDTEFARGRHEMKYVGSGGFAPYVWNSVRGGGVNCQSHAVRRLIKILGRPTLSLKTRWQFFAGTEGKQLNVMKRLSLDGWFSLVSYDRMNEQAGRLK